MRIRAVIAALPLLVLAACSSSSTAGSTSSGAVAGSSGAAASSAVATGSARSSAAPDLGPAVPAATAVAPAVAASELPTATGKFGEKPTLTFPKTPAVPSLQREVLSEGTGAVTKKGDYLVTHYLGQVWGGTKAFDNSYDRKPNTSTFQIGEGKVVPGWDVALVGVKIGSRVLLSLPPSDGYGSAGGANGAIKGTDTIVFVVDVVGVISPDAAGQTDAVPQPAVKGIPTVTGALGKEPKITVPKGLAEPKTNAVYVLAKGTGAKVVAGNVLAQLVVTDWTQSQTQSTWPKAGAKASASSSTGLQQITVDSSGALKGLIGVPLGSRVLVVVAASTNSSTGQTSSAAVAVLDIVAQA
ncbi:peptidylprolyl isomerase [Nakamurella panacisegetis]|uniref:peptidylprolyl isomerase n=1 Tax=Nakamurella panacisegetis TaxID=1090615 RepID=A0A1H0HEX4_9ACTN|nr:FKBP-type peptidyl-prolyl cis-trans isomerase [Nakamurella panacisegetis]SDO17722.1 peptidylprolyl isomerase [Nakamurella panacisegetis]